MTFPFPFGDIYIYFIYVMIGILDNKRSTEVSSYGVQDSESLYYLLILSLSKPFLL